ncbi:suppressor of fused homolog [Anthonomus grandis grandis]|uniref:suppressor of fused homolog n=1 Tax=Anthonomus grandis grandis TaxID=2921223 RepID=UPI002165B5F3|nr:suppressor of fused homolog [Anthonomus grandis grandis]
MEEAASLAHHPPPLNMLPPTPAGLESLYNLTRKIYPDQVNPLQVTALLKYWLGGPDPLDYISMYANPGLPAENVPPHWHYISFGLSDLHGDGRVHDPTGPDSPSGFGFELTFRLKREPGETSPPTWPATLMQSLAKYVFQSGNTLCASDHVSWHCALDNSESRIQHMLMTTDHQLKSAQTPFGTVDFIQIVGICTEELKATQRWKGSGVLDILKRLPAAGGSWLITDMRRGESIFELDLNAQEEVERGFELDGSNLGGVSGRCSWSEQDYFTGKDCAKDGSIRMESPFLHNFLGNSSESQEMVPVRKLDGVHLIFNLEAGSLLPLAIRGRVKHGRHFTFKSVLGETGVTLVACSVTGTLVSLDYPYVAQGSWLQVLIPDDLAQDMAVTFQALASPEALSLPKTFSWPDRKLSITIVADKV